MKPDKNGEKYWTGTNQFDEAWFIHDLEEYISELEAELANLTEPPVKPSCQWTKEKPKEPCVFITRTWNADFKIFDYDIWRFKKIKCDSGECLAWLTEDGDEWDNIDNCSFDNYCIIGSK